MRGKKEWQNPELIVLVRGKPEEAILTTCKGEAGGSPNDQAGACQIGECDICELFSIS